MTKQSLQDLREQTELLAQIGQRLRHVRQEKGLSLQRIETETMIPIRTLTAIEEGQLNKLPEVVYIQGFIRRYADAIGMNGSEMALTFSPDSHSPSAHSRWRFSINAHLRPIHLYLLYVLLMAGAVGGLSSFLSRSPLNNVNASSLAPLSSVSASNSSQTPGTPQSPVASTLQKFAAQPDAVLGKAVRVDVRMTGQSWIRVVVDGKTEYEGVLSEGNQKTWAADNQIVLRAGNAGGVTVTLNDGKPKVMGEPGAIEEVTFEVGTKAAVDSKTSSASSNVTAYRTNPL